MQIAIIAQDEKKELITQLCIAYCGILAKHTLCSTATTGRFISEATGLEIELVLPGAGGGTQQIASRIAYGEIDLLLYFRDGMDSFDREDASLIQLCDTYNVPMATNLATAEILILALDRGDLDWRQNLHRSV